MNTAISVSQKNDLVARLKYSWYSVNLSMSNVTNTQNLHTAQTFNMVFLFKKQKNTNKSNIDTHG